jgi:hypothetical protein
LPLAAIQLAESRGSSRIQQRHRCALGHCHGFARVAFEIGQRHRAIGDRHLPGADHRVARAQAADTAIADRDQETLRTHAGHAQHALYRFVQADAGDIGHYFHARFAARGLALHARWFAEQHVEGQINDVAGPGSRVPPFR